MRDENYDAYNLERGLKEKNENSNVDSHKKKDKHWRKGSKNKRVESSKNLNRDAEMLRIQNLMICKSCDNVYHNSLDTCPYC